MANAKSDTKKKTVKKPVKKVNSIKKEMKAEIKKELKSEIKSEVKKEMLKENKGLRLFIRFGDALSSIGKVVCYFFAVTLVIWFIIKVPDINSKLALIPFLLCNIASLVKEIVTIIRDDSTRKIKDKELNRVYAVFENVYHIGFLLFLFGFLVAFDYVALVTWSEGGKELMVFSLLFWIAAIWLLVSIMRNKRIEK